MIFPIAVALHYTTSPGIARVCGTSAVIAALLVYGFCDWCLKKNLTGVERVGHWTALIVMASIVAVGYGWFYWPPPPITVSPGTVSFNATEEKWLGEEYTFTVKNNGEEDKHSVSIRLLVLSSEWSTGDFECSSPAESRRPVSVENARVQFSDPFIFGLIQNSTRFPAFLVVMHRLRSHESREITLRRVRHPGRVAVTACVSSYSSVALPLFNTKNGVVAPFNTGTDSVECGSPLEMK